MQRLLNIASTLLIIGVCAANAAVAQVADSTVITDYFPPTPELIGSVDSLNTLVIYPDVALEARIEGRVFVRMVVEADGSTSEVEVMRGLGYGLDEEAVRIARQARFRWPDDYPDNLAKRVTFAFPITFELPKSR